MLKRIVLSLTFVAALGAAGLGMADTAEARHKDRCHRGGFYGHVPHTRVVHHHPAPYYPVFHSGYYYAPSAIHYHRHGRRSSFGISIGF